jgi:peptidoglycan/LPS O-acetylase OafA/YrhL
LAFAFYHAYHFYFPVFLTGNPFAGYISNPWGTVANIFLVHDWLPKHANIRQGWNGVSWTLSCEFFFYLCAPFIFPKILTRWSAVGIGLIYLCVLFIVSIASHYQMLTLLDIFAYHPLPHLLEFIIGAAAAVHAK